MCYTRASNGPLKWCIYLILLCIAKQTNKQTKTRINEIESFLCIRSSYYESMNMNNEWEVVRISPLFFDHFHLHRPHLRGVSENQEKKESFIFWGKNKRLLNEHSFEVDLTLLLLYYFLSSKHGFERVFTATKEKLM